MKKNKKIKFASMIMAVALLITGFNSPVSASTSSQIKAEQAALEKKQNELQAEIDKLADDKEKAVEYQKALEEKITAVSQRILLIKENIRTLDASIVVAESEIQKASENYSETLELLQERIKALYMAGELGTLEIVLNADSIADFADRAMFLENMTVYDQALLADLEDYMAETEDERTQLADEKELVSELKKEVDVQMEDLKVLEEENAAVLEEIKDSTAYLEGQASELEKDQDALAEELAAALEAEKEQSGGGAGTSPGNNAGSTPSTSKDDNSDFPLTWPCPGYVYISSYWGDGRGHKGIDMAANFGTGIYAAESGTVITANKTNSWGSGWGYYVSIKHNNTYQTLYAHCSSVLVSSGQYVEAGQLIALVGNTGHSFGNHLHFELYKNGTRIDPWPYLT